ncbi:hypothetical protein [Wukongibacter baidiensis]
MNLLNKVLYDERGSALPLIAVILILIIGIGCVNFGLAVMYRDRTAVRDALEAGVASSVAASAIEEKRAIDYGETLVCVEKNWTMNCRKKVCTNRDSEGNCTATKWVYWDEKVCSLKAWQNAEWDEQNYIYLDIGKAKSLARSYIEENLKLNNLTNNRAKIVSFEYKVFYDDERVFTVKKDRYLNRPDKSGTKPSGWNDPGTPAETSQYVRGGKKLLNNPSWNEFNDEAWWKVQFEGAEPKELANVDDWSDSRQEEREVYFPRWVKVKASVTVELPIPLGGLLNKEKHRSTFETTYIKELIKASK